MILTALGRTVPACSLTSFGAQSNSFPHRNATTSQAYKTLTLTQIYTTNKPGDHTGPERRHFTVFRGCDSKRSKPNPNPYDNCFLSDHVFQLDVHVHMLVFNVGMDINIKRESI